jgi:hypothetical protein
MSAPSGQAVSIESASAAKLIQLQFDWYGPSLRSTSLSLARATVRAMEGVRLNGGAIPPYYDPLYRRPPPSFS